MFKVSCVYSKRKVVHYKVMIDKMFNSLLKEMEYEKNYITTLLGECFWEILFHDFVDTLPEISTAMYVFWKNQIKSVSLRYVLQLHA